jgi:hypothetical protein
MGISETHFDENTLRKNNGKLNYTSKINLTSSK